MKILVVGSYVVDLMSRTPHMPNPGETVFGGPFQMGPGGKGSNQAVAASRLGASVTMVTKIGKDLFGDQALNNFSQENIDTTYVSQHPNETTGAALIAVDEQSENMIVVAPGACSKMTREDVVQAEKAFQEADIVLLQLEISMEAVETAIDLADQYEKPIILNPAPYQKIKQYYLEKIDYITPNETETYMLTGVEVKDKNSAYRAAKILQDFGVKTVVITLGKLGCFVFDGESNGYIVPSYSVDAIDTTGAGDAFNGAFATFLTEGYPLQEAVRRANAVAALAVTKIGTAPAMPMKEEVVKFLQAT